MSEEFIPFDTCTFCDNLMHSKNGMFSVTPTCSLECRKKLEYKAGQTCRFCEDSTSILTKETCCTNCSKLKIELI